MTAKPIFPRLEHRTTLLSTSRMARVAGRVFRIRQSRERRSKSRVWFARETFADRFSAVHWPADVAYTNPRPVLHIQYLQYDIFRKPIVRRRNQRDNKPHGKLFGGTRSVPPCPDLSQPQC